MKLAIDVVKWPRQADMSEWMSPKTWKRFSTAMKAQTELILGDKDAKDAVFALGEKMAILHEYEVQSSSKKHKDEWHQQYEYVLAVYDKLFEGIL